MIGLKASPWAEQSREESSSHLKHSVEITAEPLSQGDSIWRRLNSIGPLLSVGPPSTLTCQPNNGGRLAWTTVCLEQLPRQRHYIALQDTGYLIRQLELHVILMQMPQIRSSIRREVTGVSIVADAVIPPSNQILNAFRFSQEFSMGTRILKSSESVD